MKTLTELCEETVKQLFPNTVSHSFMPYTREAFYRGAAAMAEIFARSDRVDINKPAVVAPRPSPYSVGDYVHSIGRDWVVVSCHYHHCLAQWVYLLFSVDSYHSSEERHIGERN